MENERVVEREGTQIVELIDRRERYGHDGRAINRHSIRVYRYKNREFILDRTLDGIPPFFCLYYFEPGKFTSTHVRVVDNKEYWGDGMSWKEAEKRAFKAIEMVASSN